MKVLLINPPADLKKTLGTFDKVAQSATPPISLGYLAAVLLEEGIDVKVVDAYAERIGLEEVLEKVRAYMPDFIGISCLTSNAYICHRIAKKIKDFNKEIKIIFGGVHAALMPNEVMNNESIDVVIRGEGEYSFLETVKAFAENRELSSVKGITYRKNSEVISNPDMEYIEDLDDLPFPAWELFNLDLYRPVPHWVLVSSKLPVFPFLTSRACPYNCTFCSLKIMGKKRRVRSVKNTVDELEYLANKFNAKQIIFWDAIFPLVKSRGMEICDEIIKRGLHKRIKWMCETRVNVVDLELLKKMKEAGCRRVFYGIESGVQELLNNIRKGFTLDQVRKAIKLTKKAKIEITACFMLGLPGETKELSQQTIDFAKELNTDYAKFNMTIPYPGTELYDQAVKEGTLKSTDWDSFNSLSALTTFNPVYVPKGMTKEELVEVTKSAFRQYYLRPSMVVKHIKNIRSFEDLERYFEIFKVIMGSKVLKGKKE